MGRAVKVGEITGEILGIWGSIKGSLPFLEDEAVVTVSGNHNCTRKNLMFLAAATAFGLVKRYDAAPGVSPPPGMIGVEYDAAENEVVFTVRYRTCLATANGAGLGTLTLYNGPPETNYGRAWNFTGALIDLAGVGPTPVLPNADRTILSRKNFIWSPKTTDAPFTNAQWAPNPRPAGDARSRGTLYNLVYTALTTPQGAGLKQFPLPPGDGTEFVGA